MTHSSRMTRSRRSVRSAALLGSGVLLGTSLLLAPTATAQEPLTDHSVRVTVLSVSPSTPALSRTPQPLTVELGLTNTSDQSLDKLTISGSRGDPISSQTQLDATIAHPRLPDKDLEATFSAKQPVTLSLDSHASATVTYASTSSTTADDTGLCICQGRIYPLYFAVHATDPTGADLVVGSGQSYVPGFGDPTPPRPVQISWVWPIIDRPHRLIGDTLFTDDELATSVDTGRLSRVLSVVQTAGKTVPMTLVIDPELIDELAVMSAGPYRFESGARKLPGTGTLAANLWLTRLRAALTANPAIEVDFTPPADPDVESLTRNGLAWTAGLSLSAQARVSAALGNVATSSDIAMPADGALSPDTLSTIVRQGAHTVILSDTTLPGGAEQRSATNELASLQTTAGPVLAAITSSSIQRYVAPVLSIGGTGRADLPKLVAEIAIRAIQDPTASHYVVIVAPRDVNPSPTASQAIRATAHVFWATPLTVGAASPPSVEPADHGHLVPPHPGTPALPSGTIGAAQELTRVVPALTSMLSSTDAETLLGPIPAAIQRAESTYWRSKPQDGLAYADRLSRQIEAIESGVQILKPSGGTYTLASSNSPLPVTIVNHLSVSVSIRVRVTPVNGLPGFSARELGVQTIGPGDRLSLHIPTHVDRTGRFQVLATLYTPSNVQLGNPVSLSVHSTALGTIGVIITVVAGAVLVLALLIRFIRRMRNPVPAPGTEPLLIAP